MTITTEQAIALLDEWVGLYDAEFEEMMTIKAHQFGFNHETHYLEDLNQQIDATEQRMGLNLRSLATHDWSLLRAMYENCETEEEYGLRKATYNEWRDRLPGLVENILSSIPGPILTFPNYPIIPPMSPLTFDGADDLPF